MTHDHSGPESGGSTLHPTDVATAEIPRVDVRRYGVVGDGVTDDSAAFQAAVDAATPRGVVHVPSSLDVALESTVEVDCGADDGALLDGSASQTPFALVVDGTLRPAPGIGDGVHVHHAVDPYVSVRVRGGGEGPDVDNAVHVTDTLGGYYEGFVSEFGGTALTFTRGDTRLAGVTVGVLRAGGVGRELLMRGPEDGLLGERGGVGTVEDVWGLPELGMEFRNVRGLTIDQYENVVVSGTTERGNRFVGCEDVAIDKFAVGGDAALDFLVGFRDCRRVEVSSMFAIHIPGGGIRLDSVQHFHADRLLPWDLEGIGLEYTQTGDLVTRDNDVSVDTYNVSSYGLVVRESVTGANHRFTGTISQSGEPPTVESSDASRVVFHDATISHNNPTKPDLVLPADNDVRLHDAAVGVVDAPPKMFNHVVRESGTAETPTGSWPVGTLVEYTDTDDGSGTGLYRRMPGGWTRVAAAKADPVASASTPTPTSTPAATDTPTSAGTTGTSSGGGLPGFESGTALLALAGAALAAAQATRGDDDGDGEE